MSYPSSRFYEPGLTLAILAYAADACKVSGVKIWSGRVDGMASLSIIPFFCHRCQFPQNLYSRLPLWYNVG